MKKIVLSLTLFSVLFISCDENKDDPQGPKEPTVKLNNPINDFVWRGMNTFYYWQADMPNLDDTKDDVVDDYNTYLNGYSQPEDLFESMIFDKGTTDRFSWYIDDYRASDDARRGVNDAYGFEFGLSRVGDSNDVIGFVTYVVPNTPASEANINRGDVFNIFNGVKLNLDNYRVVNKYYSDNNISLGFADIEDGAVITNGKETSLTVRKVTENPVHYTSIINVGSKKVGYLVYNGFKYTFHEEMNEVFSKFKSEGIDELVLDLRYNGGGSVLTCAYLSSMIYGGAADGDTFAKLLYNSKNSDEDSKYVFEDKGGVYNIDGEFTSEITLNRLSTVNRIHVIVSDDTASASEMVINGLRAYMGKSNVVLVGTTTYGKNVGSFTIYDSPDFGPNNINQSHTNAMQPISFKIFNKLDESDYTQGFEPDIELVEYVIDMKPFGDLSEPLLNRALKNIDGAASRIPDLKESKLKTEQVFSSIDKRQFSKEMYILPIEMN